MNKNVGGRPRALTKLEELEVVAEVIAGTKKELIAVNYNISVRTVDRITKESKEVKP